MTYNPQADIAAGFFATQGPQQGRNDVANSICAGAVVGTPGTNPTRWKVTATGLSTSVVSTGIDSNLINYVDIRFNGTSSTGSFSIVFEPQASLVITGDTWTASCYIKQVGGALTNISNLSMKIAWVQGGTFTTGIFTAGTAPLPITSCRASVSAAAPAGTRSAYMFFNCNYTASQAIDITLRFACPQFEPFAQAGYPIITTNSRALPLKSLPYPRNPMSISIANGHFIDANGDAIILRGVNSPGYDRVAAQGYSPSDPQGDTAGQPFGPKYDALRKWGFNCVRFPMNEASWLNNYTVHYSDGPNRVASNGSTAADPGGNTQSILTNQVNQALAHGLYVILDLHWSAPSTTLPLAQAPMANNDHSNAFWTSIANTFGNTPGVIFELFNEPFINSTRSNFTGTYAQAAQLMYLGTGGGAMTSYPAVNSAGSNVTVSGAWTIASYQAMVNAVRATGATNICLIGGMEFTKDLSYWLTYQVVDTLSPPQLGATWHAYPAFGSTYGTAGYNVTDFWPTVQSNMLAIQAAGYPCLCTELGDQSANTGSGAPFLSNMINQVFDPMGMGVMIWQWVPSDASQTNWGTTSDVNGINKTTAQGQTLFNWASTRV